VINVVDGPVYYARVKVQDLAGNWSDWGEISDSITVIGSVSGLILDSNKNVLSSYSEAKVEITHMNDDPIEPSDPTKYIITDSSSSVGSISSDGSFQIDNVPIGTNEFKLRISSNDGVIDDSGDYFSAIKNYITVSPGEITNSGTVHLVPYSTSTDGSLGGKVVNSNRGDEVIVGATIIVKNWDDNIISTTTTDGSGDFNVSNLQHGTYSVTISKDGFYDYTVDDIFCDGTVEGSNTYDFELGRPALCNVLVEPQIRIVMFWGATPNDLDLHIVGPSKHTVTDTYNFEGTAVDMINERFHVWSLGRNFDEGTGDYVDLSGAGDPNGTSSTTSLVMDINGGTLSGYGPEAINLFRRAGTQYAYGIYKVTVNNWMLYANGTDAEDFWTDESRFIIYDAHGMWRTIIFPSSGFNFSDPDITFWKAFKINIQGTSRSKRTLSEVNLFGGGHGTYANGGSSNHTGDMDPFSKFDLDW